MILWFTHIVQSSLKSTNDSSKFVKTYEQERFPHPQLWNRSNFSGFWNTLQVSICIKL